MEKKKRNDMVVFYGPLPVDKPCPIIKPSEKIQLQPMVTPVAITPYIQLEEEGVDENPSAEVKEEEVSLKGEKRISARIGGVLMLTISVLSILLFVFSALDKYPIASLEKYLSLRCFYDMAKSMFLTKEFTKFSIVFVPYLIAIACVCGLVNLILSIIALISGKRKGYMLFAFLSFLTLAVASCYQMKLFSGIKEITNLLSRPDGWACITLLIIGAANLIIAFICGIICPKHKVVETVEF